jgi:RimJ/RimL family protein N-acetyltransferase
MRPEPWRPPFTLTGRYVELAPLEASHAAAIAGAGDPEAIRYLGLPPGPSVEQAAATVATLLERQRQGSDVPFTTRLRSTGAVVGMTRFLHLDLENDAVEIGGTLVARSLWRTPVNTDAKLAMLRHAFEVAGAHRVVLQTDLRNTRSQAAIARLGAVREGEHREDRHLPDGYRRTSVVYAILAGEWPTVRRRLDEALARPWEPPAAEPGPSARPTP